MKLQKSRSTFLFIPKRKFGEVTTTQDKNEIAMLDLNKRHQFLEKKF